ncbi:MAG: DUF4292 domain-containing protein [Candidatus Moranbacteria bacterium]|nr:DUF4292 domain-containing protein [Candidatus Moranbacteria bacterium]
MIIKSKKTLYLLAILVVAFSCKTKQQLIPGKAAVDKSVIEHIEKLKSNEPYFRTANVSKMSIDLDLNGRTMSVAASCRMIKDSALHISVMPALGIELFKLEAYSDSMHVFDKFNRRIYSVDYKYLADKFGVELNYASVEALITNRFFIAGDENPDSKQLTLKTEGADIILNYTGSIMKQNTRSNSDNRIIAQYIGSEKSKYELNATYAAFEPAGNIIFPKKINLTISGSRHLFRSSFSISRLNFDENVQLLPLGRERYVKVSIDQLLKK